ncbi:hypothetical protein MMC25_002300 [Agyrium rufum]|nr:hypothetical protein [Agyrium rufum]
MDSLFVNTYQLYKKHIDKLAEWLLATAESLGYKADTAATTNGGSSRPKGKARKQAKAKTAKEGTVYLITIPQFVELARFILTNGQPRKRIVPKNDEAKAKHSYFVERLKEVYSILLPLAAPTIASVAKSHEPAQGQSRAEGSAGYSEETLENRFQALEVEATDDIDDDLLADIEVPEDPKQTQAQKRRKVELQHEGTDPGGDAFDECFFASVCLFEDLDTIRNILKDMWRSYGEGEIELSVAVVISNTAISFVRTQEEEFIALFAAQLERISDAPMSENNICFKVFFELCAYRIDDIMERRTLQEIFEAEEAEELSEFCYINAYLLLHSFRGELEPNMIPVTECGRWGKYDPTSDRSKKTPLQQRDEDQVVLRQKLPDICMLSCSREDGFAFDEFTKGVVLMMDTGKIPLWLVFAAQIFIDIHNILGEDVGEACQEMREFGSTAFEKLALLVEGPRHSRNWTDYNQKLLKTSASFMREHMVDDLMSATEIELTGRRDEAAREPWSMLRAHPMVCGTFQFAGQLMLREIGIMQSYVWGSCAYTAHLYNALRQTGHRDTAWPEMDIFINLHTPKALFVGDTPTTIQDCNRRHELSMGTAITNYARDSRSRNQGRFTLSKRVPREWASEAAFIKIFEDRYKCNGTLKWTNQNTDLMLAEIDQLPGLEGERQKAFKTLRSRCQKSHQMTPAQSLIVFKLSGSAAHAIERRLRDAFDEQNTEKMGPNWLGGEERLVTMSGGIIREATEWEQIRRTTHGNQLETEKVPDFVKAAAVVKQFIHDFESMDYDLDEEFVSRTPEAAKRKQ